MLLKGNGEAVPPSEVLPTVPLLRSFSLQVSDCPLRGLERGLVSESHKLSFQFRLCSLLRVRPGSLCFPLFLMRGVMPPLRRVRLGTKTVSMGKGLGEGCLADCGL